MSAGRRAVFLDRDGVLNELVIEPAGEHGESPLRVDDVRLMVGVGEAIKRLGDAGWLLGGVTNQPAAAKGSVSVAEIEAIHGRVVARLDEAGAALDG